MQLKNSKHSLSQVCVALALAVGTPMIVAPAFASSTVGSSISDSITASVGSISGSFRRSSNSSSKNDDVAEGDYRIVEVAEAPEKPGQMRLALQAAGGPDDDRDFFLYVPRPALQTSGLQAGQFVTASHRPYGVQFAAKTDGQAFFLLLKDEWYRELTSNPVAL